MHIQIQKSIKRKKTTRQTMTLRTSSLNKEKKNIAKCFNARKKSTSKDNNEHEDDEKKDKKQKKEVISTGT